ncbi:ATP-dependent DNA helicase [Aestuariispira insulae]|uniref:ATP-dependent DNA helicase DinG n=1 Tax=Aestuariispira insulae TaxID=1461337 RepID=A0A3D9HY58_9PROT|nr:ATP-dependent DNA helicase [Aestuariispira insulae]RED54349.1 ATP-dependent DNA helicase DinG [Aestuariispira insulae]
MSNSVSHNPAEILFPDADILVTGAAHYAVLTTDGEMLQGPVTEARKFLSTDRPPVICHMPATARRAGGKPFPAFDLLELFAFVHPATFCLPTPKGLAEACGLTLPEKLEDEPLALFHVMQILLGRAADLDQTSDLRRLLWSMGRGGWQWTPFLLAAIGAEEDDGVRAGTSGLDAWKRLPEWEEVAPPPPPGGFTISSNETRMRLKDLLGQAAEDRPEQSDYAVAVSKAFINPEQEGQANVILAEAGTGVGKTLGYIAPASVWAEKNEAPVWLSTYTRNLQHQIDQELDRVFPNPLEKQERVVVRKGRENYLCLLNYEDAVKGAGMPGGRAVALGLMARWIAYTRNGDLSGGDFPSWLSDLVGGAYTVGLSDRRGECIYTACAHYNRCFIENGIRRSRRADLVVANHALVMVQAARGNLDLGGRTTRLVFDEGHHVFDAADGAFSAHLTALEMFELRRWLRGHEGKARGRARGLRARAEDLVGSEDAMKALDDLLRASTILVADGWRQRLNDGRPTGPAEEFLYHLRSIVMARAPGRNGPFGLEVPAVELDETFLELAQKLEMALAAMEKPASRLQTLLMRRLDEEADSLEGAVRARIELVSRSLEHRCKQLVTAWREMLKGLHDGTPPAFVDWLAVERADGRELDLGFLRHWIDPTLPFTQVVSEQAHGVVVTSATLTDGSGDEEQDWKAAAQRTGAEHLKFGATHTKVKSPFNYPEQTRVIVVNDVRKDDLAQVASAYRELMLASNGGALGLFTAISRLRAVHERIVAPLESMDIPLYSQHVDALNLPTLIDIFRAEKDACLLGTDAVRDGVDVPGESLRMIVFDRVPWPRPTILHKARRDQFGKRFFDDSLTRLKLKQAFGRLVRRKDDRGVFVMLDSMMPSRLSGAFPEGVKVQRIGLAEAVAEVRAFFGTGEVDPDQPGT